MTKQEQYNQIVCEAKNCRRCSLGSDLLDGHDPHVVGQGNLDAKLLFCAESPSLQETIYQRPLITPGKSGTIYEKVLASLNLTRNDVYATNTLICRPPGNRSPLLYESQTCREFLVRQLDLVRPKLVVVFGRFAASTFLPGFKITQDHGKVMHSAVFDVNVFALYHPNYVGCYCPLSKREEFKVDLITLRRLIGTYLCS
jgi:DNA polymerase